MTTKKFTNFDLLSKALNEMYPSKNPQWSAQGHEDGSGFYYDGLNWLSEDLDKPTEDELWAKIEELRPLYDIQNQRMFAYPSVEKQLDILFHEGYDGWKASIQAIKDQYPKP